MRGDGLESGIFSMFSRLKGESITVYREDCAAEWDRETGRRIRSNKINIDSCAIIKTKRTRLIQDSGGERGASITVVQTPPSFPLYTSDERDQAGADIIYARGSYWKVMDVSDECHYWEAELQMLPDTICKSLGIE